MLLQVICFCFPAFSGKPSSFPTHKRGDGLSQRLVGHWRESCDLARIRLICVAGDAPRPVMELLKERIDGGVDQVRVHVSMQSNTQLWLAPRCVPRCARQLG